MARRQSVFTGTMKFGMLTIPVKLYKPHFDEEVVPVSHLHHNCGTDKPVNQRWWCPACEALVDYSSLVKKFEGGTSLTRDQINTAKIPEKEFTIQEFVRAESVDPMNLDGDTYFIEVDGQEALEAYSVLTFALRQSERVGIAYWASRGRDKMVVIRPYRDGLVAQVLRCANITDVPSYGTTFGAEVVETATFLVKMIERKTVEFKPSGYKSQYVENVRNLLAPKSECSVPVEPAPKCRSSLADLLRAMEEVA